ncbi:winged helix-turn-helix domain-containing protein [Sphingomonas sp. BN140010]|uniref:Winged helix-turn-helix domain-containing protein n=1 Tax=Sphingomonas arvum TaxID=2992113 RepID=A0ABT3JGX6_9SPHN|nr:winged helix-turn-helix domain-containing protein [Sphingomonas sp. BN140010]MCW3798026.1 winged helix-turn-helix domain-containing protein [Sphingomonas sp. BN140010]
MKQYQSLGAGPLFERPTRFLLCSDQAAASAVPFTDPNVRWSGCTGAAACLSAIEGRQADAVVIAVEGEQAWAVQLLTAAQSLARHGRVRLFAWAPAGATEPKALYQAGAAELLEGAPVPADQVLRVWARLEPHRRATVASAHLLRHGDLTLDPERFRATRGNRSIRLSTFQVELLAALMHRPHHVFSRDELAESIWAGRALNMANMRTCFRRLRHALNGPGERELIRNIRDRGYVLDPG